MTDSAAPRLPGQPADYDGRVFNAPWEAKTFALAVSLNEQGLFDWQEWAAALSKEIAHHEKNGAQVDQSNYYHLWQTALEVLVARKLEKNR